MILRASTFYRSLVTPTVFPRVSKLTRRIYGVVSLIPGGRLKSRKTDSISTYPPFALFHLNVAESRAHYRRRVSTRFAGIRRAFTGFNYMTALVGDQLFEKSTGRRNGQLRENRVFHRAAVKRDPGAQHNRSIFEGSRQ